METALFPVRDMFAEPDDSDSDNEGGGARDLEGEMYSEREHAFPGKPLAIREFSFHALNANLVWPGSQAFAAWLAERPHLLQGRQILELGSGTGALPIFLHTTLGCNITTCDYDDAEIELNIAHNCRANGTEPLPHIRHTWGEEFPVRPPPFDLIIASDILLYVKQYGSLIQTLKYLLLEYRGAPSAERGSAEEDSLLEPRSASTATMRGDAREQAPPDAPWSVEASRQEGTGGGPPAWMSLPKIDAKTNGSEVPDQSDPEKGPGASPEAASGESHPGSSGHDSSQTTGGRRLGGSHFELERLPWPSFLMSWRRRIPKEDEAKFFDGCRAAGLLVDDLGSRVYCMYSHAKNS